MTHPQRVVVSGLGVVSPLGLGWREHWAGLTAGRSGEVPITHFDASRFPTTVAAEVRRFDPDRYWPGLPPEVRGDRQTCFGLAAAQLAMDDAGLADGAGADARVGSLVGVGVGVVAMDDLVGNLDQTGSLDVARWLAGAADLDPVGLIRNPQDRIIGLLADRYGLRGPTAVITSACAAGAQAIGMAYRMLRAGEADAVVCGATDSMINPVGLAGFVLLGAASTSTEAGTISRPFDASRSGLVMGEGAGMVVLETLEHAERRGAQPRAELVGFGSSMDAYHITEPHPEGDGAARALAGALTDARLPPTAIDHVNAHGTSTKFNDRIETMAVKRVFGEHAYELSMNSDKSMIGHLIAACGAVEFIDTTLTVQTGVVTPTINYRHRDPDCDLDYVPNVARDAGVRTAVTNSFGLGGQNACLVVRAMAGSAREAAR